MTPPVVAIARFQREVLDRIEAGHRIEIGGPENAAIGGFGEFPRVFVPVDDGTVDAFADEVGYAAGPGDDDRHAAAQGCGGGHQEALAAAVAEQHMRAAESSFNAGAPQWALPVRIVLDDRGPEHLRKRDAHAFGNRGNIFQH